MYRAVAWKALHDGVDLADEEATAGARARARGSTSATASSRSTARTSRGDSHAGDRRGGRRRRAAAARARGAHRAAARAWDADGGIVMEGRDIGTVVFPRCRREGLSRCGARRARAAARQRSGAQRWPRRRGGGRGRDRARSARSQRSHARPPRRSTRAPRRAYCDRRTDASWSIDRGHRVDRREGWPLEPTGLTSPRVLDSLRPTPGRAPSDACRAR